MPTTKVAVTIDTDLLIRLDELVAEKLFPNRSKAIQIALEEKLMRYRRARLMYALSKVDAREEHSLAEEGFAQDMGLWPEY